jgi:hypothetical protein
MIKANRKFLRLGTRENLIKLKAEERLFKKLVNETKKEKFKDRCSGFNQQTPISKAWDFAKSFNGNHKRFNQ